MMSRCYPRFLGGRNGVDRDVAHAPARRVCSRVLGLNHFTDAEFEILENHGFLTAAEKTTRFCPQFLTDPTPLDRLLPLYPERATAPAFSRSLRWSAWKFWPRWWR